jgi:hypothetical protein
MPIARIARALVQGAVRRGKYRALGSVGLRGWKMDLFRAVTDVVRDTRRKPAATPPRPGTTDPV